MTPDNALPPLGVAVKARVVRVLDGDTLELEIEGRFKVRLLDCWAPETRTKDPQEKACGLKAKRSLSATISRAGPEVTLLVPSDGDGDITDLFSFGRVLGRVWLCDGRELSELMVSRGLATRRKETS